MWQPHQNVKKMIFGRTRKAFRGFDHKFFYNHALFVGYNVTNTLYTTIETGKGIRGLAPRSSFTNVLPTTVENAHSQAYTGMSDEPVG